MIMWNFELGYKKGLNFDFVQVNDIVGIHSFVFLYFYQCTYLLRVYM